MPCIFCIAVFMALGSQAIGAAVDQISARLKDKATGPVRTTTDTDSVAKLEFRMEAAGTQVPVALTVFKQSQRVRIQLMSHDLSREDAEKLQNNLADLLELKIVERSDPESEAKVREAHDHPTPQTNPAGTAPDKPRLRWPFGRTR